jgi:hypothetical protein
MYNILSNINYGTTYEKSINQRGGAAWSSTGGTNEVRKKIYFIFLNTSQGSSHRISNSWQGDSWQQITQKESLLIPKSDRRDKGATDYTSKRPTKARLNKDDIGPTYDYIVSINKGNIYNHLGTSLFTHEGIKSGVKLRKYRKVSWDWQQQIKVIILYLSILLHWYITRVLITVYNATIYVNFNNTIAFDSLKVVVRFNVIKIYIFLI